MLKLEQVLAGRYRVEEVLGTGGMAQVYRGTDTVLSRPVAIKVLSADYVRDPSFVRRFRREAQAAARLNHPGIVSVYDTGSDGDIHFIVMELVSGRTLADVVARDGPLPPERAAAIGAKIADALGFAHESGLVHRDVKPGNVMVTERGDVKVMDFGIARAASSQTLTQTAAVLGTAAYLSPEQARGDPVDARSDVYSLGVVLYELLTGTAPFVAPSPVAVAYKHVSEEPTPPSTLRAGIPPPLEAVVLRALAKDPADRYQSAREMRADLASVAEDGIAMAASPLSVPDTVPLAREGTAVLPRAVPRRAARRRIGPWVAVAALVTIAAVAFLVLQALLGSSGSLKPGRTGAAGRHTSHPASPTPTTVTPSVTTSPSPTVAGVTVQDAAAHVQDVLSQGVAAGAIDDKAAGDILHHVQDSLNDYAKGNLDEALKKLDEIDGKIDEMVDKGDITSASYAAELKGAIQALGAAMQGQATATGETQPGGGEGDEGD